MTRSRAIEKYLRSRAVDGPWRLEGCAESDFAGAVVIPALAEGESLFATLESLAQGPAAMLERYLVVVVVNHREDAEEGDKKGNRIDLARLASGDAPRPLRLALVDAASPGLELPARSGGVGLARKIGFDLALARLDPGGPEPILASLDADTLVGPGYLPALAAHFARSGAGGAVLPFCHQPGGSAGQQAAIDRYELYLRHHALGLALAGSPYASPTVGSAMACTAGAYARAGGMNRRAAGEDFYFLQQLAKTCGVEQLRGTIVRPSARVSARVPFGTGPSMKRLLGGERDAVLFYPSGCYRLLRGWLTLAEDLWQEPAAELLAGAEEISPYLARFLHTYRFTDIWTRLRDNHRGRTALQSAFHGWFDGLKSLQFIHHLCAGPLPKVGPEAALPPLLDWAGLKPTKDPARQLAQLRSLQAAGEAEQSHRTPEKRGVCDTIEAKDDPLAGVP
ncbi:hypothetical protein [Desulfuromonas sp.]|uniref:glycosyltransferase n=1 Tax=Desulfuromonas sp. TaxID=892 RepID=UPI0025BC518B|nr:hypothetical protein [Desulfuromonas sp.]